ncbi:MAG: TIGR00159 family protein [Chloroflexi bacterium]|nr:TIGR00159 family protein [Chloroflexota bacterium]
MPEILSFLSRLDAWSALDILIVAIIYYWILASLQGTRAIQLLWGVVLLALFLVGVSSVFQLTTLRWLVQNAIPALLIAIPVIFQPELRRVLERLGRTGGLVNRPLGIPRQSLVRTVDEICEACTRLSERRIGSLIVLERGTGLQDYIDTGLPVDGLVSAQMLLTIFFPNNPLHDGAAIVRGDRLVAATCILPLSENPSGEDLGTRHRAALGITEQTDAVSIVVSEETGIISLATNGRLVRRLDGSRLKNTLLRLYARESGGISLGVSNGGNQKAREQE